MHSTSNETALAQPTGAASPTTVRQLIGLGYDVLVETGAGTASAFSDAGYVDAGATIGEEDEAWAGGGAFDWKGACAGAGYLPATRTRRSADTRSTN